MEALKMDGYTVEDIYALPDGKRAELLNGQWMDMATPSRIHQDIVMALSAALHDYIKKKGGSCRVYPAPFAVFLYQDNRTYLEPDISVICDPEKLDDRGCNGAPDLVVEVVSDSTKSRDYGIKLFHYKNAGVKEYWIVNPMRQIINLYDFATEDESQSADMVTFSETLKSHLYPEFAVKMDEVM